VEETERGKYFFIKSHLNSRVLDVKAFNRRAGSLVQLFRMKGMGEATGNQLFYKHKPTGTIRSAHSNLCLHITGRHHAHVIMSLVAL